MARLPIALELYTVRDETRRDFVGTIRKVAEMGYAGVEFAGYGDLSADEMKPLIQEAGLRVAGSHVSLEALRTDFEGEIDYCTSIDCPHLVLASLPVDERDEGDVEKLAPFLDIVGLQCRDRGIEFGYHNHDFEFVQLNGHTLLDALLTNTNPDLVKLELDVYWAACMGVDSAGFLREHAGRIPLIHLKDMAADGTPADVGDGILDVREMISAAEEAGVEWLIVENDIPLPTPLESAQRSLENISKLYA